MFFFFFFNDTATTEIYTLSLHDALPICQFSNDQAQLLVTEKFAADWWNLSGEVAARAVVKFRDSSGDRKSTRLNSSHANISYAVFCLKKKLSKPSIIRIVCRSSPLSTVD